VIRAFGTEPHYLRDLKLHHSQREINAGDGFCDFELYLRPTLDFVGKLMERGDRIKVLEPQHLAEEIREKHEKAVNLYE
jgi:predicted DNA-binding transcriptional regulator YafY